MYDCKDQMDRCLMALAEGVESDSLADNLLAVCEDVELNTHLLAAAATRQLSAAQTGLAVFEYHGRSSLTDALELQEKAENLFLFASIFCGQAEINVRRLREGTTPAQIINFPGAERDGGA